MPWHFDGWTLFTSLLALVLLVAFLTWLDRRTLPAPRHHDHLLPGTPRSPRRGR